MRFMRTQTGVTNVLVASSKHACDNITGGTRKLNAAGWTEATIVTVVRSGNLQAPPDDRVSTTLMPITLAVVTADPCVPALKRPGRRKRSALHMTPPSRSIDVDVQYIQGWHVLVSDSSGLQSSLSYS